MKMMNHEKWLITYEELTILLFSKGVSKLYGFDGLREPFNRERVVNGLHTLTNKEYLVSDSEQFIMSDEIELIIGSLSQAEAVMVIESDDERLPEVCIYPGDQLLVCERAEYREGLLKLWFLRRGDLAAYLAEAGFFQVCDVSVPAKLIEQLQLGEVDFGSAKEWWQISVRPIYGGVPEKVLKAVKTPLFDFFETSDGGFWPYQEETLVAKCRWLLDGG